MFRLISKFFSWVLSPIFNLLDFPVLPAGFVSAVDWFFTQVENSLGLLNFFVPFWIVKPAAIFFLAIWGVYHGYQLVMWILRKIPFLGIK